MAIDERAFDRQYFSKYLGKHLNGIREDKGITFVVLAEKVDMSHQYIVNVFNGRTVGNTDFFQKAALALGMTPSAFDALVAEAKREEYEKSTGKKLGESETHDDTPWYALKTLGLPDDPRAHDEALQVLEWLRQKYGGG